MASMAREGIQSLGRLPQHLQGHLTVRCSKDAPKFPSRKSYFVLQGESLCCYDNKDGYLRTNKLRQRVSLYEVSSISEMITVKKKTDCCIKLVLHTGAEINLFAESAEGVKLWVKGLQKAKEMWTAHRNREKALAMEAEKHLEIETEVENAKNQVDESPNPNLIKVQVSTCSKVSYNVYVPQGCSVCDLVSAAVKCMPTEFCNHCHTCQLRQNMMEVWKVDEHGQAQRLNLEDPLPNSRSCDHYYLMEHSYKLLVVHFEDGSFTCRPAETTIKAKEIIDMFAEELGGPSSDEFQLYLEYPTKTVRPFGKDERPLVYLWESRSGGPNRAPERLLLRRRALQDIEKRKQKTAQESRLMKVIQDTKSQQALKQIENQLCKQTGVSIQQQFKFPATCWGPSVDTRPAVLENNSTRAMRSALPVVTSTQKELISKRGKISGRGQLYVPFCPLEDFTQEPGWCVVSVKPENETIDELPGGGVLGDSDSTLKRKPGSRKYDAPDKNQNNEVSTARYNERCSGSLKRQGGVRRLSRSSDSECLKRVDSFFDTGKSRSNSDSQLRRRPMKTDILYSEKILVSDEDVVIGNSEGTISCDASSEIPEIDQQTGYNCKCDEDTAEEELLVEEQTAAPESFCNKDGDDAITCSSIETNTEEPKQMSVCFISKEENSAERSALICGTTDRDEKPALQTFGILMASEGYQKDAPDPTRKKTMEDTSIAARITGDVGAGMQSTLDASEERGDCEREYSERDLEKESSTANTMKGGNPQTSSCDFSVLSLPNFSSNEAGQHTCLYYRVGTPYMLKNVLDQWTRLKLGEEDLGDALPPSVICLNGIHLEHNGNFWTPLNQKDVSDEEVKYKDDMDCFEVDGNLVVLYNKQQRQWLVQRADNNKMEQTEHQTSTEQQTIPRADVEKEDSFIIEQYNVISGIAQEASDAVVFYSQDDRNFQSEEECSKQEISTGLSKIAQKTNITVLLPHQEHENNSPIDQSSELSVNKSTSVSNGQSDLQRFPSAYPFRAPPRTILNMGQTFRPMDDSCVRTSPDLLEIKLLEDTIQKVLYHMENVKDDPCNALDDRQHPVVRTLVCSGLCGALISILNHGTKKRWTLRGYVSYTPWDITKTLCVTARCRPLFQHIKELGALSDKTRFELFVCECLNQGQDLLAMWIVELQRDSKRLLEFYEEKAVLAKTQQSSELESIISRLSFLPFSLSYYSEIRRQLLVSTQYAFTFE